MQKEKSPSSEKPARERMLIFSHRCLGFGLLENSLAAAQRALESGVDGIEIDVRLTKDRKWVVIHNPFFKNKEREVLRVHESAYSAVRREVNKLDTMLALFSAHGEGKTIFVDVKDVGEERQLVRMLQHYRLVDQAIVISWEPEVLRRVHAMDPSIRLGFSYVPLHSSLTYLKGSLNKPLSRHGVLLRFNAEQEFDAKFTKGNSPQHYLATLPQLPLYCIQVPGTLCTEKLVRLAHEQKMRVFPFVVQTIIGSTLLRHRGVDGILTNYPLRFIKS